MAQASAAEDLGRASVVHATCSSTQQFLRAWHAAGPDSCSAAKEGNNGPKTNRVTLAQCLHDPGQRLPTSPAIQVTLPTQSSHINIREFARKLANYSGDPKLTMSNSLSPRKNLQPKNTINLSNNQPTKHAET
jgi:hypothetical protein